MRDKKVLFLVHRIYKNKIVKRGGADYITDYLESQGFDILTFEHPLNGSHNSFIKFSKSQREFILYGSGPIRWIQEIIFNLYHSPIANLELIISVDPLNFLSAYLIKILKTRKVKVLFHSIDYSEKRFNNSLLDYVYNALYKFAVRNADITTYVSKIMGKKINEFRGNSSRGIIFHLPNSPEFDKIPRIDIKKKSKYDLVFSKSFISKDELKMLHKIVEQLIIEFPKIKMHVVGNIDSSTIINPKVSRNILLYGLVSYEKNIEIICNSYIGLGWYENKLSFEKYNDSLKLREYAAAGIPAICNDKTSTAFEMENEDAGIIANTVEDINGAICSLIYNGKKYEIMHKNAIRWAQINDKSKLLETLLDELNL